MKAKSAKKNVMVSVVMGSDSDLPVMTEATKVLEELSLEDLEQFKMGEGEVVDLGSFLVDVR